MGAKGEPSPPVSETIHTVQVSATAGAIAVTSGTAISA